jgi:hypothetical protein
MSRGLRPGEDLVSVRRRHALTRHAFMSDFANLRKARHAKEQLKSYVSRTLNEHEEVQQLAKAGGLLVEVPNGLYTAWPTSRFEIRIEDEDSLRGRGVFSREQYHPGKSAFAIAFFLL